MIVRGRRIRKPVAVYVLTAATQQMIMREFHKSENPLKVAKAIGRGLPGWKRADKETRLEYLHLVAEFQARRKEGR